MFASASMYVTESKQIKYEGSYEIIKRLKQIENVPFRELFE